MPDLHSWITQQIDRVERDARDAEKEDGRDWTSRWDERSDAFQIRDGLGILVAGGLQPGAVGLIVRHDPAAVLRRCAADRKILEHHAPAGDTWDPYACTGCGNDGSYCSTWIIDHTNDCPTLLALAEGYGLTDEQRATLDRPEPEPPTPGPGFLIPDALSGPITRTAMATVPPALRGPNWKARP